MQKKINNYIFLFILLILISCKEKQNKTKENTVVKIATLKGPSAMSMVKMIDSKVFKDKNIKAEFIIKDEPIQIRALLLQNETDFAILPTTFAALLYNKGVQYKLAAIPVWGTLYLFGEDTCIKEWNDLKNKHIYVMARGMTPDVMFRFLLEKNNIDPENDVKLDYSFPTHIELANAVAANKAKLAVISEPLVSMVIAKNPKVKPIFSFDKEWEIATQGEIPLTQTALIVNPEFASKHKDLVDEFLTEYKKSSEWVNRNTVEASKLIVKYNIILNEKVAQSSISRSNIKFEYAYNIKDGINKYLEIFYNFDPKITGGKLPDEEFYYKK
ncbi:MAG: ABC transporter substrate-binding protein [Bacteroidales bacterium]|nr:ABC transporter substrate-binding protein [Bacteroidales bacterium]